MFKIDVINTKGEKKSKLVLPKSIFSVKTNPKLVAMAVKVYLSNQRQSPAKTKTRAEVAYSTVKLFKQKGTGRARHGSRSAPIFVKGGVSHGPAGDQNYKLKLGKNARQKSLKMVLTDKLKEDKIMIIEGLEKISPKTAVLAKIIGKFKKEKVGIVLAKPIENLIRAGRNIPYLEFLQAKQLNTYKVLNTGILIFSEESLKTLEENLNQRN